MLRQLAAGQVATEAILSAVALYIAENETPTPSQDS
jgi:hypothetical protein